MCPVRISALFLILSLSLVSADVLILADGQILTGDFIQISYEEVLFKVDKAQLTIPVDKLSSVSLDYLYNQFLQNAKTFEQLVQLGSFCEKFDLLQQAITTYHRGEKLEALTEEEQQFLKTTITQLEEKDAKRRLDKASELYKKQELDLAKSKLILLIKEYPQSPQAQEAQKMLVQIEVDTKALEQLKKDQKAAKQKETQKEELEGKWLKFIEEAKTALTQADLKNGEGLSFQAQQKYQKGVKVYEAAVSLINHAEELGVAVAKQAPRLELQKQGEALAEEAKSKRLIVYMNFAHLWAVSLNWQKATLYVNRILAIQPDHSEALKLRMKITEEMIRRNK